MGVAQNVVNPKSRDVSNVQCRVGVCPTNAGIEFPILSLRRASLAPSAHDSAECWRLPRKSGAESPAVFRERRP
jgi:hypothetical protein